MFLSTTLKYPLVRRNCSSRCREKRRLAGENCFFITEHPTMHRHGTMWLYQFPERPVTIRCPSGFVWITSNKVLFDTGVIHNATACIIAANEIGTLAELHGTSQLRTDVPTLYLPDLSSMFSSPEEPKLGEVIPLETGRLNDIKTRQVTPPRSWDVYTLFHIRQATRHDGHTHWYLIITVVLCILTVLLLLYSYARAQWHHWFNCGSPQRSPKESNPAPQISPTPTVIPESTVSSTESDDDHDNATFVTYSMQHTI